MITDIDLRIAMAIGDADGIDIPDYSSDLNDMARARMKLDGITEFHGEEHDSCAEEAFMGNLSYVLRYAGATIYKAVDDWEMLNASAKHQAQAMLLTVGTQKEHDELWEILIGVRMRSQSIRKKSQHIRVSR